MFTSPTTKAKVAFSTPANISCERLIEFGGKEWTERVRKEGVRGVEIKYLIRRDPLFIGKKIPIFIFLDVKYEI